MARPRRFKLNLWIAIPLGMLAGISLLFLWRSQPSPRALELKSAENAHGAAQPTRGPVVLPAESLQTLSESQAEPVSSEERTAARVAKRICANPTLRVFSDPTRGCESELSQLYQSLSARIEQYSSGGVTLRPDNCSAQSPDGVQSSAEDVLSDLYQIGRELLNKGLSFDFDRDLSTHHLNRMRLVALCHIQKNTQYWLKNPEQMPEVDDLENHLVFDHDKGQPGASKSIGLFLKVLAQVEEMRRGQN